MSPDNETVERRLDDALAELAATTTFQDDAWDRITRRSGRRIWARRLGGGAIAVAAAAAIAFAFAIRIDESSRVATTAPAPTTAPPAKGCPFTAEVVSEIIGDTVTGPESSTLCYFGTGAGDIPSVSFEYRPASDCTQESLRENGYVRDEHPLVEGLGVDAYSNLVSVGVSLIVCNGDQPFAVLADGIQGDPLTADVALARLVLNG